MEGCNAIPDVGTSIWTARVLSIIVKNMQSYIVAVVWGVTEVFFFYANLRETNIAHIRIRRAHRSTANPL